MIQRLTESFLSGVELVESECRLAKYHAAGFLAGGLALIGLSVLTLVGVLAFLVGATLWLGEVIGLAPALTLLGATSGLGAGWGAYIVGNRLRETKGES